MCPRLHLWIDDYNQNSSNLQNALQKTCVSNWEKSKRNQLIRTTHLTVEQNAASRVFCGLHNVALQRFFLVKSTLVVRCCLNVPRKFKMRTYFVHIDSPMQLISSICLYSCLFIPYCYLLMLIISTSGILVGEIIRLVVQDEVKRLFAFIQPVSNLMIV